MSRTLQLGSVDEPERVGLLQVLIEETLEVPTVPRAVPRPPASWEAWGGPSMVVTSGLSLGGGLRAARRLGASWVLFGAITAGGWSESLELGHLSWQHVDGSLGLAWSSGPGPFELRVGLAMRGGVVAGQGAATSPDTESRAIVGGFAGPSLHVAGLLSVTERWFLAVALEPGLSLTGRLVSAGDTRRGFSRWWLVAGLGVGLRW